MALRRRSFASGDVDGELRSGFFASSKTSIAYGPGSSRVAVDRLAATEEMKVLAEAAKVIVCFLISRRVQLDESRSVVIDGEDQFARSLQPDVEHIRLRPRVRSAGSGAVRSPGLR